MICYFPVCKLLPKILSKLQFLEFPTLEVFEIGSIKYSVESGQVSIVSLKKGQLKMLSSAWDRNLGGRDFTEVLFDHFAKEFLDKTKLDILNNPKSCFRLRTGCEKVFVTVGVDTLRVSLEYLHIADWCCRSCNPKNCLPLLF